MTRKFASCQLIIVFFLTAQTFATDSTTFHTFIKNVSVPQSEITLDSTSKGRIYYSGKAYFDIETPGITVPIHVYLEEVPFEPYVIAMRKYLHGNGKFVDIDSLSSGDIGMLSTKKNCAVKWSYSTANAANHCRIKIGMGNYLYAKTKDSLEGKTRWVYTYNNIGSINSVRIDSLGPGSISSHLIFPEYTRGGQKMIDDTGNPFAVNGYDNLERMTFSKEADQIGLVVHFFYGYAYDEKGRAVHFQQLPFGSTPQNHGVPFNVDTFSYDTLDRAIHECRQSSFVFKNPIFWPDTQTFNTIVKTDYYYEENSDSQKQFITMYYDKSRNLKPLSSIAQNLFHSPSGRLDSLLTIQKGLDSVGAIYGPTTYEETRVVPIYDAFGWAYKNMVWERYYSPDSSFQNIPGNCYRREYDNAGNVTKQFDNCDSNEVIVWSMTFNGFNAPVMQQVPNQSPGNGLNTYRFTWDLINLDSAQEYYHE